MLVEDDKSLREIYGVRLLAEGYDIVSAGDGEEALAVAIKERPALIISDVMMPKISGFDMLDILRSTTETRNVKVIMMTALSSDEQRARGEQLGADRYLVKSQVGIEDVVRVVHEVLGDAPGVNPQPPVTTAAPLPPQPAPLPAQNTGFSGRPTSPIPPVAPRVAQPPQTAPRPVSQPAANPQPAAPTGQISPVSPPRPQQDVSPVAAPQSTSQIAPAPAFNTNGTQPAPSARAKVIEPINNPHEPQVNINELLDKEMAKQNDGQVPNVPTANQEREMVNSQLNAYTQQAAPVPQPPQAQPPMTEPDFIATPPQASTTSQQPALPQQADDAQLDSSSQVTQQSNGPQEPSVSENRPTPPPVPPRPPVAL